jgi:dGTPase
MEWEQLLCHNRLGESKPRRTRDARTEFQRDFDRIVFSSAFRRLQDKTQVFPLARSDYVRTRLTHSLEVSSVGRTLGVMAGDAIIRRHRLREIYPQDFGAIVAAACLAHDIGNPPFGHAGEDAIRLWFRTSQTAQQVLHSLPAPQQQDFLRFEGNAQGFRLLTRLQNADNPGGLQLTYATLGTFSKYPCASTACDSAAETVAARKFGFYQDDRERFAEAAEQLGLIATATDAWCRHPLAYLVEAADDICYRIIDIEDGFRLNRLTLDETLALLRPLVDTGDWPRIGRIRDTQSRVEFLRAKAIGRMIDQVYDCFIQHEDAILSGELPHELLSLIPSAGQLHALKQLAMEKVYVAPEVIEIGVAGFEVLAGLLEAFVAAVNDVSEQGAGASSKSRMLLHLIPRRFSELPHPPALSRYRRVLGVIDFVAGMTDSYAVGLFKKITGISLANEAAG